LWFFSSGNVAAWESLRNICLSQALWARREGFMSAREGIDCARESLRDGGAEGRGEREREDWFRIVGGMVDGATAITALVPTLVTALVRRTFLFSFPRPSLISLFGVGSV